VPKAKNIRLDIDIAVELIPLSKDKVRMVLLTTIDPGIKNLPLSIIAWLSKKVKILLFGM